MYTLLLRRFVPPTADITMEWKNASGPVSGCIRDSLDMFFPPTVSWLYVSRIFCCSPGEVVTDCFIPAMGTSMMLDRLVFFIGDGRSSRRKGRVF